MRTIIQRALQAHVSVAQQIIGQIKHGVVVLVGFTHNDTLREVSWMVDKITHLRIFDDEDGKLNRSLMDTGGQILSVSQFTLYGDAQKGRRPSFTAAARPELAMQLYDSFNHLLREKGFKVETGRFGAEMQVALVNSGPITLMLESP